MVASAIWIGGSHFIGNLGSQRHFEIICVGANDCTGRGASFLVCASSVIAPATLFQWNSPPARCMSAGAAIWFHFVVPMQGPAAWSSIWARATRWLVFLLRKKRAAVLPKQGTKKRITKNAPPQWQPQAGAFARVVPRNTKLNRKKMHTEPLHEPQWKQNEKHLTQWWRHPTNRNRSSGCASLAKTTNWWRLPCALNYWCILRAPQIASCEFRWCTFFRTIYGNLMIPYTDGQVLVVFQLLVAFAYTARSSIIDSEGGRGAVTRKTGKSGGGCSVWQII